MVTNTAPHSHLDRPGGRIAFSVGGSGPLVICTPGMGDLRSVYRDLTPALIEAGYRVAEVDLRGHGDSDTSFRDLGDVATGEDLLALIEHLGGRPAVLVGNSMGASASLWAAAERPDAVAGLILLGPFVRDAAAPRWQAALQRALFYAALMRPWGSSAWSAAYRRFSLGKDPGARSRASAVSGRLPTWFDAHVDEIRSALRDPAHLASLRSLVRQLTHGIVEERLGEVRAPALVAMGAQDPDFPDPSAELSFVKDRLEAAGCPVTAVLVPECGHYPQSQRPDLVGPAAREFLAGLSRTGADWGVPGQSVDAGPDRDVAPAASEPEQK